MSESSIPLKVPAIDLPYCSDFSMFDASAVVAARNTHGRAMYFVKLKDGTVCVLSAYEERIHSMSVSCRKAYCKLAGIPYARVRKEIAERNRSDEEQRRKNEIDDLLSRAKKLGLKLTVEKPSRGKIKSGKKAA